MTPPFEPTAAAAAQGLRAVRPHDYARSRNHLEGAVTRLGPYITHGFLNPADVLRAVLHTHPDLPAQHRLVCEFGWREYFHHVWEHLGDGIFESLHPGVLPDDAYARTLPEDIREARTGVTAIDTAVRELYATGWLHNHARMWLASYCVHLRKVHWRTAADWLYVHLLDGDLASNHLSWQWVAGTASAKPYLFNADNVARFAPAAWHSGGSVVDTSYEALEHIARSRGAVAGASGRSGVAEPAALHTPPEGLFGAPDASVVRGRRVRVVHAWALSDPADPAEAPGNDLLVAVADTDFHHRWPWSLRRWDFVGTRLREMTPHRWLAPAQSLHEALATARDVQASHDLHLGTALVPLGATRRSAPWKEPDQPTRSFSQYWRAVTRRAERADELLSSAANDPSPPGAPR